jgi:hypothetical protein
MRSIGVLKNRGLKAAYASTGDARHRPVSRPATGSAGIPCFRCPRGVRNAGRFTAPAAPGVPTRNRHTRRPAPFGTGQPLLVKATAGPPSFSPQKIARPGSRYFACVPHADGFCGLLHVPRNCPFCGHAAWFGRTAARTCTWTVRPTLLRALIASQGTPSASRFTRFAGHARRRLSPLSRGSRTFHP